MSTTLRTLCAGAGASFVGDAIAEVRPEQLRVRCASGRELSYRCQLDAERVVALPRLAGLRIPGVPADGGSSPSTRTAASRASRACWAAGDGTSFPIRQGAIGDAAGGRRRGGDRGRGRLGAPFFEPEPFRPVLRGMLLTGGDDRFLPLPARSRRRRRRGRGGERSALVAADQDLGPLPVALPLRSRRGRGDRLARPPGGRDPTRCAGARGPMSARRAWIVAWLGGGGARGR